MSSFTEKILAKRILHFKTYIISNNGHDLGLKHQKLAQSGNIGNSIMSLLLTFLSCVLCAFLSPKNISSQTGDESFSSGLPCCHIFSHQQQAKWSYFNFLFWSKENPLSNSLRDRLTSWGLKLCICVCMFFFFNVPMHKSLQPNGSWIIILSFK